MKTFIKIIAFFLASFISISSVFAYDLNTTEKYKLDIVVQKLEASISNRGEYYRSVYISKLTDLRNRNTEDKIITYINYVIDSLNKSLDIYNIFGGIDNNYPGCSSTTKYVGSHGYNLSSMYNGENSTVSISLSIPNGYDVYRQTFTCSNGVITNVGYEQYVSTSCTNGYYLSGRSCVSYYNVNRSCDSTSQIVNGHTYYLSALSSGYDYTRTTTYNISNGYDTYRQTFSCDNGVFTAYGSEEYVSTNCNSNYYLSGRSCYYNGYNNNYNYNYNYSYNNCQGAYKYYNSYSAYVDYLSNGSKRQVSFNIGNGYRYVTYLCSNGTLVEDSAYTTCSYGYVWNGSYCYYNNTNYYYNEPRYIPYPYNPPVNNCIAVGSFLVGTNEKHSYYVPAFNAGTYTTQTISVNVYGGVKSFSQSFYCSNGTTTITPNSPEIFVSLTCNAGFQKSANGSNCEKVMENASCRAHSENVNGHSYNIPMMNSGDTTTVLYSYNVNGIMYYQQSFSCNNGSTTRNGNETINSCLPTHNLIDGSCIPK